MAAGVRSEDQVGVRELRRNLSQYLARVKRGRRLQITEHGNPIAILAPLPAAQGWLERLVAEGRATPARVDLLDVPPPPPPGGRRLSEILAAMREEER